jgi:hypothetical protein
MFGRSRTQFHDKNCKKAVQHFHCAVSIVFDRVKSVALRSANIRKLAKDHKVYGSAASIDHAQFHFKRGKHHIKNIQAKFPFKEIQRRRF